MNVYENNGIRCTFTKEDMRIQSSEALFPSELFPTSKIIAQIQKAF